MNPVNSRWSTVAVWLRTHAYVLSLVALVGVGAGLRISQFVLNRNLFIDEFLVVENLTDKGYRGLTRPLKWDQRAPAGFLWSVKGTADLLGYDDLVFRIVPLIAGLAALGVFPFFLRSWNASRSTIVIGTALVALSPTLIFYSSELKQYSSDVLCALLVWMAFAATSRDRVSGRDYLILAAVGAATIWFCIPIVFVMAGLGLCFAARHGWNRRWRELACFAGVGMVWLTSFVGIYWLQYRHYSSNAGWMAGWTYAFPPTPDFRGSLINWLYDTIMNISVYPIGLSIWSAATLALIAGIGSLGRANRYTLAAALVPFLILGVAASLRVYPYAGRVILFLIPGLVLLMADGLGSLLRTASLRPIGAGLIALLMAGPVGLAAHHVFDRDYYRNPCIHPNKIQSAAVVLGHIRNSWQEGDLLFLANFGQHPYEYYAPKFGFHDSDIVKGPIHWDFPWHKLDAELRQLRGHKRVWIAFTHTFECYGISEQHVYKAILDGIGTPIAVVDAGPNCDGRAFLYDLSAPPGPPRPNEVASR